VSTLCRKRDPGRWKLYLRRIGRCAQHCVYLIQVNDMPEARYRLPVRAR